MWDGTESFRHVIYLSHQLVLNPHSRVYAIRGGAPELQGWDAGTVVAVRTYNLLVAVVQGLSKGEPDPGMFIDYPGAPKEPTTFEPKTLAELLEGPLEKFLTE